jgi:hypothetical protein
MDPGNQKWGRVVFRDLKRSNLNMPIYHKDYEAVLISDSCDKHRG